MKKIVCCLTLLLVSAGMYAQVTKSKNKIINGAGIQLDPTLKLIITGVKTGEQEGFSVLDDNKTVPATKPDKKFESSSQTLSFDFTAMFNAAKKGAAYVLVLPDGTTRDLLQTGTNTEKPPAGKEPLKGYSGIAFWDALAIKALYDDKKDAAKGTILKYINYYNKGTAKTWGDINNNPFFKKAALLQDVIARNNAVTESAEPAPANILGRLGGLDVTKYVQAFADFLRDRIKEELTVAYLEKLKAMIQASEELTYMLPKTRTVFLSNDAFNIPNMGTTYKAAFAEDLQNLLPDFEKMVYAIEKEPYKTLRTSDGFIGFMTAWHYTDLSAKNYHPADIISTISKQFEFKDATSPKTTYAIAIINMLSQNLLDTSGTKWAGRNLLRDISKDEMYIFFGLLYEKYPDIFNSKYGSKSLLEVLTDASLTSNKLVDKIYDLLLIVNTIDERIKTFKESTDKKETVLTYFLNNSDALLELIDYAVGLAEIEPLKKDAYYKWKAIIEHSLEAAKAISENDIGKLGINVITVINELVPADNQWKKDLTEFIKLLSDFSAAKTSADIKALLDHYAAPVHSYRVARTYR